jgi:hypothetical protein
MEDQDLITNFFKGESIELTVLAKNNDGTTLTDPADYSLLLTVGVNAGAVPFVEFNSHYTLIDPPTATFNITVPNAELTDLLEGKTYYYNIWSQGLSGDPRLQCKGKIVLNKSIAPT